jgi:uncharacterized protein (DUF1800 family)
MADGVALLLRRAGFGPSASGLAAARAAGYATTVDALTAPAGRDAGADATPVPKLSIDPYASLPDATLAQKATADAIRLAQAAVVMRWWLDRMVAADHQCVEKLLWFWHGHWATSIDKVLSPQFMLRQHLTLRASGNFAAMARAMVMDPALVYYLDGHTNTKQAPNENLARELMELFLLGIGRYTERDVKESGRALTGRWLSFGAQASGVDLAKHDDADKTILGVTANFDAPGLVDLLLRQDACPRFLAARLWFRYGSSDDPLPRPTEDAMVAAFPSTPAMLRAMFLDDAFIASAGRMVKQPVEWLIGAMRQLHLRPSALSDADLAAVLGGLSDLGQLPWHPPSVGGWASGAAWLTPSSAQVRFGLAQTLARLAGSGPASPEDLADTLAVDVWSDRTYTVLREVTDPTLRLTIGLSSPEYLVT